MGVIRGFDLVDRCGQIVLDQEVLQDTHICVQPSLPSHQTVLTVESLDALYKDHIPN